MNIFRFFLRTKKASTTDLNTEMLPHRDNYELKMLAHYQLNRAAFIDRIARWDIAEIEEREDEYKKEIVQLKKENKIILSRIFEEKIAQLRKAKLMIHNTELY